MSLLGQAGAIAGEGGKRSGKSSRRACGECGGCDRRLATTAIAAFAVNAVFTRN